MTEQFTNLASSTLNGTITSGATSLVVASASSFPSAGNFRILVETEIMLVTAVSGTTFTVTRGQESTTAGAHNSGVPVTHILTAGSIAQTLQDRISASGKRYTATDSNTQILWTLDDSAAPYANTGNGGTLNLSDFYNTTNPQMTALFNSGAGYSGTAGSKTADTSIGESTPLSVSLWIYLLNYNTTGEIIDKKYQTGSTWTSPYTSFTIGQTGSGNWFVGVTFSGARTFASPSGAFIIPLYSWTLLSGTYDTTSGMVKAYINGTLAAETSVGGSPSIDWGSHGGWQVGAVSVISAQGSQCIIDDIRVESTLRSQAYYQAQYRAGVNLL